jgi:hypothetical protein
MTVAKAHDVKVFAVHLTTTPQLCLHNDAVRALGSIQVSHTTNVDVSISLTDD